MADTTAHRFNWGGFVVRAIGTLIVTSVAAPLTWGQLRAAKLEKWTDIPTVVYVIVAIVLLAVFAIWKAPWRHIVSWLRRSPGKRSSHRARHDEKPGLPSMSSHPAERGPSSADDPGGPSDRASEFPVLPDGETESDVKPPIPVLIGPHRNPGKIVRMERHPGIDPVTGQRVDVKAPNQMVYLCRRDDPGLEGTTGTFTADELSLP